ncbi:MAG TPA: hypothetical protein VFJ16_00015 [Longimicrobium sp.]|nr:hypothetical protein [Longimicrobium sp.]
MRKTMLAFAALLVLAAVHAAAQVTDPVVIREYDAHIDPGGIVHCINPGTKCTA